MYLDIISPNDKNIRILWVKQSCEEEVKVQAYSAHDIFFCIFLTSY